MNLKEYATHRRERGLRGSSHVAVIKAIQSGRLAPPAVKRKRGSKTGEWVIDPIEADRQWAANTVLEEPGVVDAAPEEPDPVEVREHAERLFENEVRARGKVPPIGESRQKKAAIETQLLALELARKRGQYVDITEIQRAQFPRIRAARDTAIAAVPRMTDAICPLFGGATQEQRRALEDTIKAELRQLCEKIAEIGPDGV